MMTIFGFSRRQAFGRAILAFIAVTFSFPVACVVLAEYAASDSFAPKSRIDNLKHGKGMVAK